MQGKGKLYIGTSEGPEFIGEAEYRFNFEPKGSSPEKTHTVHVPSHAEAEVIARSQGTCLQWCKCNMYLCTGADGHGGLPLHFYPEHGCQRTDDDIEEMLLGVDPGMEMSREPVGTDSKSTLSLDDIQAAMSDLWNLPS